MSLSEKECPPAPEKPKKTTGVLFEFGEQLDFSELREQESEFGVMSHQNL